MTSISNSRVDPQTQPKAFSRRKVAVIVLITIALTLGAVWLVRTYLYPNAFRPVELSEREQSALEDKLDRLGIRGA